MMVPTCSDPTYVREAINKINMNLLGTLTNGEGGVVWRFSTDSNVITLFVLTDFLRNYLGFFAMNSEK